MKNKKICGYCGSAITAEKKYCSQECMEKYRYKLEKDLGRIRFFILGNAIGFVMTFLGILLGKNVVLGSGITFMGLMVIVLPLSTPETILLFGYYKARRIARILGVLLGIVGIWIICTTLFG